MWYRLFLQHILHLVLTVLVGGFLGASLVRFAPGFGTDEQFLNARLSHDSQQVLERAHESERNIFVFYCSYLANLFRGDLGVSRNFNRPVRELLHERVRVSFQGVGLGLLGAWVLGLGLALPGVLHRRLSYDLSTTILTGLFLCFPSAVLALLCLYLRQPVALVIALVLFAPIFRHCRNQLIHSHELPHVLLARAKGLRGVRIMMFHVLPPAAPPIIALFGVSVSMAFGACIPAEAICDSPGLGQLAWQAALSRDLNVLIALTLLVVIMTLSVNSSMDLLNRALNRDMA
jgi:peptide/nickel transport system permease protein